MLEVGAGGALLDGHSCLCEGTVLTSWETRPTSAGCEKGKITTEENSGSELREDFVEGTVFGERRNSRAVAQGVLVRLVREGR